MGRFHILRVAALIFAAALLSWYSRQGINNPFAGTKIIQITGSAGEYGLALSAGKPPKQLITLFVPKNLPSDNPALQEKTKDRWELITLGQDIDFSAFAAPPQLWTVLGQGDAEKTCSTALGWPQPHKSAQAGTSGRIVWKTVYPFSDSASAVLLTVDKTTTLICDSFIYDYLSKDVHSQFKEKLDLLIIPPADAETVKKTRELFRPRLLAVIPPCGAPAAPYSRNIICAESKERWDYRFKIRNGRLKAIEQE